MIPKIFCALFAAILIYDYLADQRRHYKALVVAAYEVGHKEGYDRGVADVAELVDKCSRGSQKIYVK